MNPDLQYSSDGQAESLLCFAFYAGPQLENITRWLGLGTHLFVKASRPVDSEVTFSVFESSCHLLQPV